MDCETIMRKYSRQFLAVFNIFFALVGSVIISIATSIKAYYHEYELFLEAKYFYASDLMIIVGVIILLISFCGCFGALKENACMATCFSSLLFVILILEVLVVVGGVLLKNRTEKVVETALYKTIEDYKQPNYNETTTIWDQVQNRFECCGVQNYTDWMTHNNATGHQLPISCCNIPSGTVDTLTCKPDSEYLHSVGCLTKMSNYIEGHATTIEGVGIGIAIFQILSIILSWYLSKQIRSDYETV